MNLGNKGKELAAYPGGLLSGLQNSSAEISMSGYTPVLDRPHSET